MVDIDLSQLPFTLLDDRGRERVARGADMAYFDSDEVVLEAGQPGEFVFIIHKGEIAEFDPHAPVSHSRIAHYTAGDLFGAISILNGTSRYRFKAEQESLCYVIPKALFERLCDDYPAFADFFRHGLVQKTRLLAERRIESGVNMVGFMLARISECMRAPVIVEAVTTIGAAVARLNESHADSLLVGEGRRFGVVTKTDLLNALVMEGATQEHPVVTIAHFELVSARPDQYLFDALVQMTRHRVARIVVVDQGRPVGVVELTDLLSYFSSHSYMVGLELEQADTVEKLARASARLPGLIQTLTAQGVKLRFVMDLLAALNGRIVEKAFLFLTQPRHRAQSCLVVMGSEGRGEQILKTDQDNALIVADGIDWPDCAAAMQRVTETLCTLGYPPCPGNIMVSNPAWVNSESGWRATITRWAERRDGASLMNLAIMLDANGVAGDTRLLERLRRHLFDCCAHDELLLSHFARAALHFSAPLTLFGSLKKPRHGIDIKKGGIFPIVHGVRTLALECRITATSTLARLEALSGQGRLEADFAADLGEALALFIELRLKRQLAQLGGRQGSDEPNLIMVQNLSSLERDLLREALHIVKDFQQRLTHRFHLEY
ncbi:putative nucleotidyltransferase substrate binding domain-containing protein [Salinicola acroporae]|uniref:Cyclic nucleotide-binding protein n=1 Tax=Salinicola acroporae TaxID=1541440 RepID=A0ABT6I319_9GAMM|nr:putative nucleotidyltransferase substrate binding domain-containing protein [Salinicola acroporae]MDH4572074.1 cyclic nucleotide-binding protein [Salinicola acroporae]